jgi:hypothetical protein
MKVLKLKKNLAYLLELIIKFWQFEFVSFKNLMNLGHVFHEKSFV